MVRVNLVGPRLLADQHLVAEYDEILMLFGYVKRHPAITAPLPSSYRLGPGHMLFFKDKLKYLKRRHELLKEEMRRRGFRPTKTIRLSDHPKRLRNDWEAKAEDFAVITTRLRERLRKRDGWYRYCGERKPAAFFLRLLEKDAGGR